MKNYLLGMDLPFNVLLVMGNAPIHPPGLQNDHLGELKFFNIQFLPPNPTLLFQPMDQQIISNFKKLCTRVLFKCCFGVTEGTNLTLEEFWKCHFYIVACLKVTEKVWKGLPREP